MHTRAPSARAPANAPGSRCRSGLVLWCFRRFVFLVKLAQIIHRVTSMRRRRRNDMGGGPFAVFGGGKAFGMADSTPLQLGTMMQQLSRRGPRHACEHNPGHRVTNATPPVVLTRASPPSGCCGIPPKFLDRSSSLSAPLIFFSVAVVVGLEVSQRLAVVFEEHDRGRRPQQRPQYPTLPGACPVRLGNLLGVPGPQVPSQRSWICCSRE